MSFETPVVSRLSIVGATASPLRKKSILALANQGTPTADLNDDDAERNARRRKSLAPQAASTPEVQGVSAADSDEARRKSIGLGACSGLSAAQLAEHYANCIKLSTENKITVKNAFNLQLIDYMKLMLQRHDKQMEDFQVASCTLDASTKIYSYRVDSVHSDVVQMASGLGRTESNKRKNADEEETADDNEAGGGGDDGDEEREKTKPAKKKKKGKSIIAVKKETLLRKQRDYQSLDTFVTRLSAALTVSQAGECPFQCSIKNRGDRIDGTDSVSNEESSDVLLPPVPDITGSQICPPFANFSLKGWRPENDPSPPDPTPPEPPIENGELAFDMNQTPEPIPDIDTGPDNYFDDDDDNHGSDLEDMYAAPEIALRAQARVAKQRANCVNLQEHISLVPLEYSYFPRSLLSMWAGPNHWKINPVKKGKEVDEKCANVKKKRQKKEIVLDFDDQKDFDKCNAARDITKKTIANWSKERNSVPVNLHKTPESFMSLFLRERIRIVTHDEFNAPEVDDAVSAYQYDNPADKSDFCPNVPNDDDDGDCHDVGADMDIGSQDEDDVFPTPDGPQGCELQSEEPGAFTGDNLIEPPNKIARSYIPYQMRAKKVDMKKLKGAIWDVLTVTADSNKENCSITNMQDDVADECRKIEKASKFSDIFTKVPRLLPTKMAEAVSCGLAFVALLHLANEKNLSIEGLQDMSDLNIRQG